MQKGRALNNFCYLFVSHGDHIQSNSTLNQLPWSSYWLQKPEVILTFRNWIHAGFNLRLPEHQMVKGAVEYPPCKTSYFHPQEG